MLTGEHKRSLDEKGRFYLPPEFKEDLGEEPMITLSLRMKNLVICSLELFEKRMTLIKESTLEAEDKRNMLRRYVGNAYSLKQDKEGRVRIPGQLLKKVDINPGDEVLMIGMLQDVDLFPGDNKSAKSK